MWLSSWYQHLYCVNLTGGKTTNTGLLPEYTLETPRAHCGLSASFKPLYISQSQPPRQKRYYVCTSSVIGWQGLNFRHGGMETYIFVTVKADIILDIEDMLKTIAFIKGHKWTSMMVKRVYFGNWLRDYSQAVDVGSLKGVSAPTIRILVRSFPF
jgi:hypothetical protein